MKKKKNKSKLNKKQIKNLKELVNLTKIKIRSLLSIVCFMTQRNNNK